MNNLWKTNFVSWNIILEYISTLSIVAISWWALPIIVLQKKFLNKQNGIDWLIYPTQAPKFYLKFPKQSLKFLFSSNITEVTDSRTFRILNLLLPAIFWWALYVTIKSKTAFIDKYTQTAKFHLKFQRAIFGSFIELWVKFTN